MAEGSVTSGHTKGYFLYQTNRLEESIERHVHLFQSTSPFSDTKRILLQNRAMQKWLSQKIASSLGISLTPRFDFPLKLVREILKDTEEYADYMKERRLLFEDDLFFVVYETAHAFHEEGYQNAFMSYLFEDAHHRGKKRQVLEQTTRFLYRYFDGKDGVLEELARQAKDNPVFDFQYRLYQRIFKNNTYVHIHQLLSEATKKKWHYNSRLSQIIIVGSCFLSPKVLDFLYYLRHFLEVHHFFLIPSKDCFYPLALPSSVEPDPPTTASQQLQNSYLSKKLSHMTRSTLSDWGRREIVVKEQCLVLPKNENFFGRFKRLLFHNREEETVDETPNLFSMDSPLSLDSSFQIIEVSTTYREVEMVKNKILSMMEKDETLGLNHICVLAPDINVYYPVVERIFSEEDPVALPYHLVDLNLKDRSKFIQGFLTLFSLPKSEFSRETLLKLVSNPFFLRTQRMDENDLSFFEEVVEVFHVFWGIGSEHKKRLGLGSSLSFSFQNAFYNLYDASLFDKQNEWNLHVDSHLRETLSRFDRLLSELYNDLFDADEKRLTLPEWAVWLTMITDKYLVPTYLEKEEKNEVDLFKATLSKLRQTDEDIGSSKDRRYDFDCLLPFLEKSLDELSQKSDYYRPSGITFSSIRPFRTIPFRITFVMGLQGKSFGYQRPENLHDLQTHLEDPLWKSEKRIDEISLMEILLSTEEQLIFSYQRDLFNDKKTEYSPFIDDIFLFVLTHRPLSKEGQPMDTYKALQERWIEKHPLLPMDEAYYRTESPLKSYQKKPYLLLKLKNLQKQKSSEVSHYPPLSLPASESQTYSSVTVHQLSRFLKDPVAEHCKTHFFYAKQPLESRVFEQLELDALSRYRLHEDIFHSLHKEVVIERLVDEKLDYLHFFADLPQSKSITQTLAYQLSKHYEDILKKITTQMPSFQSMKRLSLVEEKLTEEQEVLKLSSVQIIGEVKPYHIEGETLFVFSHQDKTTLRMKDLIAPYLTAMCYLLSRGGVKTVIFCLFHGKHYTQQSTALVEGEAHLFLERLYKHYDENRRTLKVLYPDMAEKLLDKRESSEVKDTDLEQLYQSLVDEREDNFKSGDFFYSDYREAFFESVSPHLRLSYSQIRSFLDEIYAPLYRLIRLLKKEKTFEF